ncbi:MAG: YciI family protein [Actinobacteria bacterium]|nr:MAG: YciI family protein [Actinomycetota bacterium]
MKYMLLICDDPALFPRDEADYKALMDEYAQFSRDITASGERVSGLRLEGVERASSVRKRDERVLVSDGPFAETKEQVGGLYVVDVSDRERALELAAKLPGARTGVIEVRPLFGES